MGSQINFTKIFIFIGSLSLIGIFGFICFYSKEKILFLSFNEIKDRFSLLIFVLSCFCTVLYSIKLLSYFYKNSTFIFYSKFLNFGSGNIFSIFVCFGLILFSFVNFISFKFLSLNSLTNFGFGLFPLIFIFSLILILILFDFISLLCSLSTNIFGNFH